jgi:hypothetical protein
MEDDIGSPSCWKSIVLATAIAVNYCHMSARWVEGWAILAPGARCISERSSSLAC